MARIDFAGTTARTMAIAFAGFFASALVGSGALLGACGGDSAADEGEEAGPVDASRRDGRVSADGAPEPEDGGVTEPSDVAACKTLKKYYETCGGEPLCPLPKFDTWCLDNTKAVESEAYRRGTIACATAENCDTDKRKDCMYRSYSQSSQSTAQELLTVAFCQMCQPSDVTGCRKRTTSYNTVAGPKAVTSEFLAVWELSDAVVDQVRTNCTGSGKGAVDAGIDGGLAACETAFDKCAGEYFVNALPDCP